MSEDSCINENIIMIVENMKEEDSCDSDVTVKSEPLETDEDHTSIELELLPTYPPKMKGNEDPLDNFDAGPSWSNSLSVANRPVRSHCFSLESPCSMSDVSGAYKKSPMMISVTSTPESVSNSDEVQCEARGNENHVGEMSAENANQLDQHSGKDKYLCRTDSKGSLRRYRITHETDRPKSFVCNYCDSDFKTDIIKGLRIHLISIHHCKKKVKLFACSHCNYKTDRQKRLAMHLRAHQTVGIMPFACSHCTYRTDFKRSLARHLRTHQAACSHCEYRTDDKAYLARHLLTHQTDKSDRILQFACSQCDYKTDCKQSFTRHLRSHLRGKIKLLACSHCSYRSEKTTNLVRHLRTHYINRTEALV